VAENERYAKMASVTVRKGLEHATLAIQLRGLWPSLYEGDRSASPHENCAEARTGCLWALINGDCIDVPKHRRSVDKRVRKGPADSRPRNELSAAHTDGRVQSPLASQRPLVAEGKQGDACCGSTPRTGGYEHMTGTRWQADELVQDPLLVPLSIE
jgi:hypothetical protein